MTSSIIWLFARLASLALGVFAFSQATPSETNFDPVAGMICGAVAFVFVLFTLTKDPVRRGSMFSLTSPFFPPWKYVQSYWFTTGALLFLSAATNLLIHLSDPAATSLYTGLTLLGAGLLGGALFARHRLSKTQ